MFIREKWATLALLLFGIIYLLSALQLGVKVRPTPESGFVPFLLGVTLIGLSCCDLARFWIGKWKGPREAVKKLSLRKMATVIAQLVGGVLSLSLLGFPITATWVTFVSSRMMGLEGFLKPVILGVSTAVLADIVFTYFLSVPLPGSIILLIGER